MQGHGQRFKSREGSRWFHAASHSDRQTAEGQCPKSYNNDANYRNQLLTHITNHLQTYQDKVPELKRIALVMNNPQHRGKLDALFGTDSFGEDSIAEIWTGN
jgi:ABC-type dipeptide/oligopeptide/nickel transport system permease subunit